MSFQQNALQNYVRLWDHASVQVTQAEHVTGRTNHLLKTSDNIIFGRAMS